MSRASTPLTQWLTKREGYVTVLGAVILALAIFGDRLGGDFVWDDVPLVAKNPALVEPGGLMRLLTRDLWGSAGQPSTQLYHPLPMASLWLGARIHGVSLAWFRFGNVMLHVTCALLLVALVRRVGLPRLSALLTGSMFLAHPLVTEPVMWLTGRHDTLAALFGLLALLAYPMPEATRRALRLVLCGLASAAAFASKEPYVVVPALVVGLSLLEGSRGQVGWRLALSWLAPLSGVAAIFALRRLLGIPSGSDQLGAPPSEHLLNYAAIVRHYATLALTFAQAPTISSFKPISGALAGAWLAGSAVGCLALARVRDSHAGKAALFGIAWFFLALAPHVLSLPILGVWGNRYGYFPLMGLALALAAGLAAIEARGGMAQKAARALPAVATLFGLLSTRQAAAAFHDDLTLYEASVRADPDDGRALYHLAHAVRTRQGCAGAIELLVRAVERAPSYARAQRNVAGCWLNLGQPARALPAAERAVQLEPQVASHRYNLGAALLGTGARERGIEQLRTALRLDPTHTPSRRLLASIGKP
ncbi:MAG TPA: hypothetical protein VHP33_28935 [Polyangiaceae bacterium]|nr:hypothetical protein [Polyangiaceae bacterium]